MGIPMFLFYKKAVFVYNKARTEPRDEV